MGFTARSLWWLYAAAALAFAPILLLQYVGEEAVTVVVAQEMWANKNFITTSFYGHPYGRPGLFAWLTLTVTWLLGWGNILVAARIVTIAATILTGLSLAWLTRRIFKDNLHAAFAAVVFLSGDILLYRGWLAYADPLFSLFVFLAIACAWIATTERRYFILSLGLCALAASFLTKTYTGYIFYGIFALVLLWRHPARSFLLHPISLGLHAAALIFPFAWDELLADRSISAGLIQQFNFTYHLDTGTPLGPGAFLTHLAWFPIRTVWYLLPASAIVIYCLFQRTPEFKVLFQPPIDIAVWGLLLNLPLYWLTPYASTRYIMPIYPLFALVMSFVILRASPIVAQTTVRALAGIVAIAYIATLAGFPLYERFMRGNYAEAAQMILARVGDHPLFVIDHSSAGASITANLNVMRAPKLPLTRPPDPWISGFAIALTPDDKIGRVADTIVLGSRVRYLLCRGEACE